MSEPPKYMEEDFVYLDKYEEMKEKLEKRIEELEAALVNVRRMSRNGESAQDIQDYIEDALEGKTDD